MNALSKPNAMIRVQYRAYFLLLLLSVILYPLSRPSMAQDLPTVSATDTSYFEPGQHNANLIEAVIRNDPASVALLLDRGADPNVKRSTGNSALMYAAETGNIENMKMLVERGADINFTGFRQETPLFMAIFHNDFEAAKYLLEQGADPNVKDSFGVTPLIYAAASNQYQSADLLLFYDADEEVRDSYGNDPLIAAVTFENIETADVLLQNGLDPDVRDNKGNTPLIITTQHGNYDILDLLLDYNADPNICNKKNYTPLAYAVVYEDTTALRTLITNGADVNHSISRGRNIAELARITGNQAIIGELESNGAELTRKPDFSEFHITSGHSFNGTDYLVQFRGSLVDRKYGFYGETGVDYRPFLLKFQVAGDDTIFQYRERRIGWSHGAGKYFKLFTINKEQRILAYTALTGYLSFPSYSGTTFGPAVDYSLIPAAGIAYSGHYVGIRSGLEWYRFGNLLEKGLKFNVSFFVRLVQPEDHYDRKEIYWE